MDNRKKLKQEKKRLARISEQRMSIESFLAKTLGIRDNRILSKKITHNDIKALFPHLKRESFEKILENPTLVNDGSIIIVEDSLGRIVPYENPRYDYEKKEFYGEFVVEPTKVDVPDINTIDLTQLSIYELQKLLHLYERNNLRGAYRKVRNELVSRRESRHSSKESIERTLRKEKRRRKPSY